MKNRIFLKLFIFIALINFIVFGIDISFTSKVNALVKNDFEYEITRQGNAIIVKYLGSSSNVVVPDAIDGKPVTEIREIAFAGCENITGIVLPESLKSIGEAAFYGCLKLKDITIPTGVESIGSGAFKCCESLESVTIPDKVKAIESHTFGECKSLTNITIPNSVIKIGEWAFAGCYSLKNIKLPGSLTNIGNSVFSNCESLEEIILPDSVLNIGGEVFYRCVSLKRITISSGVNYFKSNIFYGCENLSSINVNDGNKMYSSLDGVLFNKDKTKLVKYPQGKESKDYSIPNAVISIEEGAFSYSTNIERVIIPENVKNIGKSAFSYCSNLSELTMLNGVENIDADAFFNCSSIKGLTIPVSVKNIGNGAFSYCTSLSELTILNGVENIGEKAFYNCGNIKSITIPDSVKSIGKNAFSYCASVVNIKIPGSVASIGDLAFASCFELVDITVDNDNEFYSSQDGVLFDKTKTKLIIYPPKKVDTNYIIPSSVKKIEQYAFSNSVYLSSIEIPDGITSIGDNAFRESKNLMSVNIPDGVTKIGEGTFFSCENLRSVTIGNNVREIGYLAFAYCYALKEITVPMSVREIGDYAFTNPYDTPLKIYGYSESVVQQFAVKNSIGFTAIGKSINLDRLEITKKPDKITYVEGDAFDPSGLVVTGYYNNGDVKVITDYEISGYDFTYGKKTITVDYQKVKETFNVQVEKNTSPIKNDYQLKIEKNKILEGKNSIRQTNGYEIYNTPDQAFYHIAENGDILVLNRELIEDKNDSANSIQNLVVNTYSSDFEFKSTLSVRLPFARWGGVFAAPDGYFYIPVGQANVEENDDKVVYSILKFDKNFNISGRADIKGGDIITTVPFDAAAPSMDYKNGELIVHASRERYTSDDGLNHQSNITFRISTSDMKVLYSGEEFSYNHVSHSFNQIVRFDGDNLIYLDHGDAYPRSVFMQTHKDFFANPIENDIEYYYDRPKLNSLTIIKLHDEENKMHYNYTGTSVSGFETGKYGNVIIGNSVPHDNQINGVKGYKNEYRRNIYVAITDKEGEHVIFRWLTDYDPKGEYYAGVPRLIKLNENRYAILYQAYHGRKITNTYYEFTPYKSYLTIIDSKGNVISTSSFDEYFAGSTQPVFSGSKIIWASTESYDNANKDNINFYTVTIPDSLLTGGESNDR